MCAMTTSKPEPDHAPRRRSAGPQRSEAAHAAILDAADVLLRAHGPSGVTFEAVARLAKAGKPTLYRWWPNKIELLLELYDRHKDRALTAPDLGSFEADLLDLTDQLWTFWRTTSGGAAFAAVIAAAQSDPATQTSLAAHFADDRRNTRNLLNLVIERAVARGELATTTNIQSTREAIMAVNWFHLLTNQLDAENIAPAINRLLTGLLPRS